MFSKFSMKFFIHNVFYIMYECKVDGYCDIGYALAKMVFNILSLDVFRIFIKSF